MQPGMVVIDSKVQSSISVAFTNSTLIALALTVVRDGMSNAIDNAKFFGMDMDHFTGFIFFITDDFRFQLKIFEPRQAIMLTYPGDS